MDAMVGTRFGGTGARVDASCWPAPGRARWALAGGLDPNNVAAAIEQLQPLAVDAASGIEGAVKGEKDAQRMRDFVAAVKRADAALTESR